jgi:cation/acetate symporter
VTLTFLSPAVWEVTLGNPKGSAWFQYSSPALFSMSLAFFSIWLVSWLDRSEQAKKERLAFEAQQVRSETGYGAAAASSH